MKLYIPEIGDRIRLTADWTFDLYNETRNSTLMEYIGDTRDTEYAYRDPYTTIPCTIPAGTVLKIDRIYIRKGLEDFSSLTFFWEGARTAPKVIEKTMTSYTDTPIRSAMSDLLLGPTGSMRITQWPRKGVTSTYNVKKPARPVRFWAKLADVNQLEFEQA